MEMEMEMVDADGRCGPMAVLGWRSAEIEMADGRW
jgi:hypothetical protein